MGLASNSFRDNFALGRPAPGALAYIVLSGGGTLHVNTYGWFGGNNFRAVTTANPSLRGTNIASFIDAKFHPSGNAILVSGQSSNTGVANNIDNVLMAWQWNKSSGWGSQYSAPSTAILPSNTFKGNLYDFNPAGTIFGYIIGASPYGTYHIGFDASTGFGTVYNNSILTNNTNYSTNWNGAGNAVVTTGSGGTSSMVVRPWNGSTFGTASNSINSFNINYLDFTPNGNYIVSSWSGTTGIRSYAYNSGTNTITSTETSTFAVTAGVSVLKTKIVSDGSAVIAALSNGDLITVQFNQTTGAFGSQIGNTGNQGTGNFSLTKDEKYLVASNLTTLRVYNFDKTTGIGSVAGTFTLPFSSNTGIDTWQPV